MLAARCYVEQAYSPDPQSIRSPTHVGYADADRATPRFVVPAMHIRLAPGQPLFEAGQHARRYYFLESGTLAVELVVPRRRPTRHLIAAGTLFIFDCGGRHIARCWASTACRINAFQRNETDRLAQYVDGLRNALQNLHSDELDLILGVMAANQPCGKDKVGVPGPHLSAVPHMASGDATLFQLGKRRPGYIHARGIREHLSAAERRGGGKMRACQDAF